MLKVSLFSNFKMVIMYASQKSIVDDSIYNENQ